MNELKRKSHQLLQDLELFHLKQADNKANKYLQITKQVTTGQSATWDIRIPHQVQVLPFQILASVPEKTTDDVSIPGSLPTTTPSPKQETQVGAWAWAWYSKGKPVDERPLSLCVSLSSTTPLKSILK